MEISNLVIEIDATSAERAIRALDGLTDSSEKLESQTISATQAEANAYAARQKARDAYYAQNVAVVALTDSTQKLLGRYDPLGAKLRSLQSDFAKLNDEVSKGGGKGYDDAIDKTYKGLNAEIAKTKGLMEQAGAGMEGATEKTHHFSLANATAQRELMVLGHEAMNGNYSRIPGSMMVLAGRTGLLSVMLSAQGLAFIGVAAAVAVVVAAYAVGWHEMEKMNDAMRATGNFAGVTRESMRAFAGEMSATGEITMGTAKHVVTELVASGKIHGEAMSSIAKATVAYAAMTGEEIDKIAPKLVSIFESPTKGAMQLNESMHFLSVAEIEHIRHLEDMGRLGDAQAEFAKKFDAAVPKHLENLGVIQKGWRTLKGLVGDTIDNMLQIGQVPTHKMELFQVYQDLEHMLERNRQASANGKDPIFSEAAIARGRAKLNDYMQLVSQEEREAKTQAQTTAEQQLQQSLLNSANGSIRGRIDLLVDEQTKLKAAMDAGNLGDALKARYQQKYEENTRTLRSLNLQIGEEQRKIDNDRVVGTKNLMDDRIKAEEATLEYERKTGTMSRMEYDQKKLNLDLEKNEVAQMEIRARIANGMALPEKAKAEAELLRLDRQRQQIPLREAEKNDMEEMAAASKREAENSASKLEYEKEYRNIINSGNAAADYLLEELDALGKTERERRILVVLHQEELRLNKLSTDGVRDNTKELGDLRARLETNFDILERAKNQVSYWDDAAKAARGFGEALMNGVGSAINYIRSLLKKFLADLIGITMQRWVLQFGANVVGGSAGAALGNQAAQLGSSTISGAVGNTIGSAIAGTTIGGTAIGGVGALGAGFSAALPAGVAGPTMAGASWMASAGNFLGTLGATGWGLIIVAAIAVVAALAQKPGGRKVEGGAGTTFGADGSVTGRGSDPLFGNISGGQLNPQMQKFSDAAGKTFAEQLKALGGTNTGGSFGFKVSTDPAGTANTIIDAISRNSRGDVLYHSARDIGRDNDKIQPELQLESQRAILAALQASDFPAAVKAVLVSVDAASASADEITNVINAATAVADFLSGVAAAIKNISGPLDKKALDIALDSNRSLFQVYQRMGPRLQDLIKGFDGTQAGINNVVAATNQYRQAQAQLIVAIDSVSMHIKGMLADTTRSIQMAGLTQAQQYDYLYSEAAALRDQMKTLTDPAQIEATAEKINADLLQAFNLLSPDQQVAMKAQFLDAVAAFGSFTEEQLTRVRALINNDNADDPNSPLHAAGVLLKEFVDKMNSAAETQMGAATTNQGAANTMAANVQKPLRVEGTVTILDSRGNPYGSGSIVMDSGQGG